MIAKRLLMTGQNTSHLVRTLTYALELGAEVLHVGLEPAFAVNPPAGYRFAPVDAAVIANLHPQQEPLAPEAQALVTAASQQLAALWRDFAPHLTHAVGVDALMQLCVLAGIRPLLVSALGFLEDWVYRSPTLRAHSRLLLASDALLVEPPMLVEVARSLLPASVRVEELAIGLEGRTFYPVEAAKRAAWRRALNVPAEAMLIFSPRGWEPSYGHDFVVAAFAQALPDLPAPAYLFFTQMGRSGDPKRSVPYYESVRQMAVDLGVAERVRWLPIFPTVSMATLYNAADLVISYRAPDTFPVTVLEAMACARPVIVSDVPTLAHSVIAEHCRLVAPKDSHALAAAMIDLAQQPPTPAALAAARQAVLARYDKPVVMQRLAAIYDAVYQATQGAEAAPASQNRPA